MAMARLFLPSKMSGPDHYGSRCKENRIFGPQQPYAVFPSVRSQALIYSAFDLSLLTSGATNY